MVTQAFGADDRVVMECDVCPKNVVNGSVCDLGSERSVCAIFLTVCSEVTGRCWGNEAIEKRLNRALFLVIKVWFGGLVSIKTWWQGVEVSRKNCWMRLQMRDNVLELCDLFRQRVIGI